MDEKRMIMQRSNNTWFVRIRSTYKTVYHTRSWATGCLMAVQAKYSHTAFRETFLEQ